jgi:hypothetical protein
MALIQVSGTGGARKRKRGCGPCAKAGGSCAGCPRAGSDGLEDAALRKLARLHRSGELAGLADIDMGAFVVGPSTIDQEAQNFDGRLNAWLLDVGSMPLPKAFLQQIDAFVARWRAIKDGWYWFGSSKLADVLHAEGDWNKLRDQANAFAAKAGAPPTSIAPSTVTVDGKAVRADQVPNDASFFGAAAKYAKWGAVALGVGLAVKVGSDMGVFRKLGRLAGAD